MAPEGVKVGAQLPAKAPVLASRLASVSTTLWCEPSVVDPVQGMENWPLPPELGISMVSVVLLPAVASQQDGSHLLLTAASLRLFYG